MLGRTQMPQLKATNLTFKATLSASKGRVHGRRLDWIIYELTGNSLSFLVPGNEETTRVCLQPKIGAICYQCNAQS